jgi:transglutaminase superfamily protein
MLHFRPYHQISPTEFALFMAALPLVAVVRLALWAVPSGSILRSVARFERSKRSDAARARVAPSTVVWAIEAASRRIPQATCLTQAIAAKLLLRLFGYDAQLCLGVGRLDDGALRAHAWLERQGRPVLGAAGVHSLVRFPEFRDRSHGERSGNA